jgi:tripartite-type tricarboxylate transporter receptor subunit TctC
LIALLLLAGGPARADEYPNRAIRIVVGFTPGGPSDLLTRTIGQKLSERLGQPVFADNRPGAGGNLAGDLVAKAAPDGYTLMTANNGVLATNAALYRNLPFDPVKDLAPIILVGAQPNVLVVNPTLPAHSVGELVALAKAQPGKLNYASSGNGAAPHLTGELFKAVAGVDIVHIAYKGGGPAIADLIAGQGVQLSFATSVSVMPYIQSGQLRALAVTTAARSPSLPDLPTMAEAGVPGVESTTWHGIVTTAGTPPAIIARLNREIAAILELPDVRRTLSTQGVDIIGGTPEAFGAYIRAEVPKWTEIVRISGARAD